jgi:Ser/Thr protein kinase RdoA (MazF antagonist)
LPPLEGDRDWLGGWRRVAEDPEPFLGLGLASRGWFDAALPALVAATEACRLDGDALVHGDMRSDNLCLTADRVLVVDWNVAAVGHPLFDLASWLPSLESEGGPPPEELLPSSTPDVPEMAAVISGYFASRAGLPAIPTAPRVRVVQLSQLRSALPWAARALGLPRPV